MRVGLRVSPGTVEQLEAVLEDAAKTTGAVVTSRSWLVGQLNSLLATYALPWRKLEATGRFEIGTTPPPSSLTVSIERSDLQPFRMDPADSGDGPLELVLGERTVARIERACSITAARNRALGLEAQQPWHTPREWLEVNLVERIAQARAQIDLREMAAEELGPAAGGGP